MGIARAIPPPPPAPFALGPVFAVSIRRCGRRGRRRGGGRGLFFIFIGRFDNQIIVFVVVHQKRTGDDGGRFGDDTGGYLELFHHEIGRDQCRVAFDPDGHAIPRLDLGDVFAFAVHQEIGNRDGRAHQHFFAARAHAFFFELAQDRQGHVVVRPQQAGAVAMAAHLRRRLEHAGAQALARHFHQAETGNPADLNARAVCFQLVLEPFFDGGVVLAFVHVDEIDHDQTGKVTQAQLARYFVGGLEVGFQRGLFDRAFLGRAARVHVDGDQCLGDPDHDITARGQLHRGVEHPR